MALRTICDNCDEEQTDIENEGFDFVTKGGTEMWFCDECVLESLETHFSELIEEADEKED